jgi:hypothetical protein
MGRDPEAATVRRIRPTVGLLMAVVAMEALVAAMFALGTRPVSAVDASRLAEQSFRDVARAFAWEGRFRSLPGLAEDGQAERWAVEIVDSSTGERLAVVRVDRRGNVKEVELSQWFAEHMDAQHTAAPEPRAAADPAAAATSAPIEGR